MQTALLDKRSAILNLLPGTGKPQACVERIRNTLQENPLAQVRVIVPDQLQPSYFRRRFSSHGGAIGAYIGIFGDLYKFILEDSGAYMPTASNALLHCIVQEVVDEVPLLTNIRVRTFPGFIRVLRDAFAELKRALIYPKSFIELSKATSDSQQERAQLYSAYQLKLHQLGWADV